MYKKMSMRGVNELRNLIYPSRSSLKSNATTFFPESFITGLVEFVKKGGGGDFSADFPVMLANLYSIDLFSK